jgi:hypothetical protein
LYRDTAAGGFGLVPAPGQFSGRPKVFTAITPALLLLPDRYA